MNTEESKIWYSVNLDTTTLKEDASKVSAIFREMSDSVETEAAKIDNVLDNKLNKLLSDIEEKQSKSKKFNTQQNWALEPIKDIETIKNSIKTLNKQEKIFEELKNASIKGFITNKKEPTLAEITAKEVTRAALGNKIKKDELSAQSKEEEDAMNNYLIKWGNMEQKRAAITSKYNKKISNAPTESKKLSLVKEKEKKLSDLGVEELMASKEAKVLFGTLSNVSSKNTKNVATSLKGKATEQFKDGKIGESAYKDMLTKIDEATDKVTSKNPFAALAESAKDAFKKIDENDAEAVAKRKKAWKDMGESMGKSLDSAAQGMKEAGNIANSLGASKETKATISQITGVISGASDISKGLATGDVTSIIKGVGGMVTSMIDLFDFRSKRANKIIKEESKNIDKIKKEYKDLERTVADSLGTDYYKKQIDGAKLLQDQIDSIDKQIEAEESKRKGKRNKDQIDAWKEEQKDLTEQIKNTKNKVIEELSTTDLKSYSMNLSSSIIEGLASGLDNANEVIDEKMDTLLKNMIAKQFDMIVTQNRMKPMFDAMAESFGEKSEGGFALTDNELHNIVNKGKEGKAGIINSLDDYKNILDHLGLINKDVTNKANSASGAITAELTEQTGSELLGIFRLQSDNMLQMKDISTNQFEFIKTGWTQITDIAKSNLEIATNTFRTANNTDGLIDGIKGLDSRLKKIETNTTKSYAK